MTANSGRCTGDGPLPQPRSRPGTGPVLRWMYVFAAVVALVGSNSHVAQAADAGPFSFDQQPREAAEPPAGDRLLESAIGLVRFPACAQPCAGPAQAEATNAAPACALAEHLALSNGSEDLCAAVTDVRVRPTAEFVAPNTPPTLRGTSVRGEVTSRPGSFRKGTLQDAWDDAVGPNGGRLCPTCDGEVLVPPGSGVPRDWDGSHNPSWSNREFPGDVQRPDVMDNFNEGVSLECPGCNRPAGNNDTRFGDARSGWPD